MEKLRYKFRVIIINKFNYFSIIRSYRVSHVWAGDRRGKKGVRAAKKRSATRSLLWGLRAIAGVATVGYAAYKHWDKISDFFGWTPTVKWPFENPEPKFFSNAAAQEYLDYIARHCSTERLRDILTEDFLHSFGDPNRAPDLMTTRLHCPIS